MRESFMPEALGRSDHPELAYSGILCTASRLFKIRTLEILYLTIS